MEHSPLSIPETWQQNVLLAHRTSWKIGGPARYLCAPKNLTEAAEAFATAHRLQLPLLVMGKGSNLLLSDRGWNGVVLALSDHLTALALESGAEPGEMMIIAQAGAALSAVTALAARSGAAGVERLTGIPGSIGGAVMMNAGAYGCEISDTLLEVTACDSAGKLHTFSAEECALGYRTSRFQKRDLLILEVRLQLHLGEKKSLQSEVIELLKKRKISQPLDYPSGGSLFKRPSGDYAGRLIEEAGLKGFRIGDAAISTKHANFAINLGNATAQQVFELSEEVIRRVRERSGVTLEREQLFVGEFEFDPTHKE